MRKAADEMLRTRLPISVLALAGGIGLGCSGRITLTEAGRKTRAMKSDPTAECVEIDSVEGKSIGFFGTSNEHDAKKRPRNAAGQLGARNGDFSHESQIQGAVANDSSFFAQKLPGPPANS